MEKSRRTQAGAGSAGVEDIYPGDMMCCEFDELTMRRHELRRREQIVKRDASSQLIESAMVLRFDRSFED